MIIKKDNKYYELGKEVNIDRLKEEIVDIQNEILNIPSPKVYDGTDKFFKNAVESWNRINVYGLKTTLEYEIRLRQEAVDIAESL